MIRLMLALVFLLAPGVAHAEWHEASTRHFVVYSDDSPERVREFASRLEQFDKALRLYLKLGDPDIGPAGRVTVYVVDDSHDVEKLAGTSGVSGFYRADYHGPVAYVPRRANQWELGSSEVLLRSYAHHFLATMAGDAAYPRWFFRGFAEFAATARFPEDGAVTMGHPSENAGTMVNSGNIAVEALFTADYRKLSFADQAGFEGRSWLLTHYLLIGSDRRQQLGQYLRAINEGKKGAEAATGAFGDLTQLNAELLRYKRDRLKSFRLPPESVTVPDPVLRKLRPVEAATIEVRMRSKRGTNARTAPAIYEDAKRAVAPHANDPHAQIVLAEAAFDAKDYAAAEAAADRALAVDPATPDAHLYKAMARIELVKKAGDTSGESWAAARKSIVSAIQLDLKDPEPLVLLYYSYKQAGQPPSATARDALSLAHRLAHYDHALRLYTAKAYIEHGDDVQARELLEVLIHGAFDPAVTAEIEKLIAEIDARAKTDKTEEKPAAKP